MTSNIHYDTTGSPITGEISSIVYDRADAVVGCLRSSHGSVNVNDVENRCVSLHDDMVMEVKRTLNDALVTIDDFRISQTSDYEMLDLDSVTVDAFCDDFLDEVKKARDDVDEVLSRQATITEEFINAVMREESAHITEEMVDDHAGKYMSQVRESLDKFTEYDHLMELVGDIENEFVEMVECQYTGLEYCTDGSSSITLHNKHYQDHSPCEMCDDEDIAYLKNVEEILVSYYTLKSSSDQDKYRSRTLDTYDQLLKESHTTYLVNKTSHSSSSTPIPPISLSDPGSSEEAVMVKDSSNDLSSLTELHKKIAQIDHFQWRYCLANNDEYVPYSPAQRFISYAYTVAVRQICKPSSLGWSVITFGTITAAMIMNFSLLFTLIPVMFLMISVVSPMGTSLVNCVDIEEKYLTWRKDHQDLIDELASHNADSVTSLRSASDEFRAVLDKYPVESSESYTDDYLHACTVAVNSYALDIIPTSDIADKLDKDLSQVTRSLSVGSHDLWNRSKSTLGDITKQYAEFQFDMYAIFTRPLLDDVTVPTTAAFLDAYAEAQSLDFDICPSQPELVENFAVAVNRAQQAWIAADRYARRVGVGSMSQDVQDDLRRAHRALELALDAGTSEHERDLALARCQDLINHCRRTSPELSEDMVERTFCQARKIAAGETHVQITT